MSCGFVSGEVGFAEEVFVEVFSEASCDDVGDCDVVAAGCPFAVHGVAGLLSGGVPVALWFGAAWPFTFHRAGSCVLR